KYEETLPDGTGTRTITPGMKEDRLGGKRVVMIMRPQKDGGLQSAEVREGDGKTLIQLMEVKAGKIKSPLPIPFGTTPKSDAPSLRGPLDQDVTGKTPAAEGGKGAYAPGP